MPRIDAIKQTIVTKHTYYSCKKYSGMGIAQLKELKWVQEENERPN